MDVPTDYREYVSGKGLMEAFLTEQPMYMVLWPLESIEQYNAEYEVPRYAPGFLAFGTNGGGELLAFDSTGAVFYLPAIGMEAEQAIKVTASWADFTHLIEGPK